jgi:hypothetical protein
MNLNDFSLHSNDIKHINSWYDTFDKPLFITGTIGIGKTSIVNVLLKNYTIVNIEHKLIKNINEFIQKTINECDISMMFMKKRIHKAIVFDNISYTDRNLIQFLKNLCKTKCKTPFIITCNDLYNKQIQMISNNCYHIYLKYTFSKYSDICKKLYPNIKEDLIINSNYNFHTVKSNIHFYENNYDISNSFLDSKIEDIQILNDNFKKKINTKTLFQMYSCDYNTIGLNILDDIFKSKCNNISNICKIYENMITYDNYETFRIKYNIHENDISILYSIYLPYNLIHSKNMRLSKCISYNSYTSKSLIYTHLNLLNDKLHYDDYFYILNCLTKEEYIKKNINKKLFNNYIKLYEYLYDTKICKKSIKKLYDSIK